LFDAIIPLETGVVPKAKGRLIATRREKEGRRRASTCVLPTPERGSIAANITTYFMIFIINTSFGFQKK
jgi:hypothetical protein